jgi:hypothetical protein
MNNNINNYEIFGSISEYCIAKGITKQSFCQTLGWAQSKIFKYRDGVAMRQDTFDFLLEKFPDFLKYAVVSDAPLESDVITISNGLFMSKKQLIKLYKTHILEA